MLSPDNPDARLILGIVSALFVLVMLYNTLMAGSRPYRRFVKFKSSWKRRNLMRKWLNQSFIFFGGLSVIALLLSWQFIAPMLRAIDFLNAGALVNWSVVGGIALVLLFVPLTTVVVSKKGKMRLPRVIETAALLPRNRQELKLGAALSLNAALVEEVLFRLALPAMLYGATGNAIVAVVISIVLYGALNAYKGFAGAVSSALVGTLLMGSFVVSGVILVPIVIHALIDLRSLVFIPVVFGRVHTLKARW